MMTKFYLRLRWRMYDYQRTHPLVTPGVWVCGLLMLVMWLYNIAALVWAAYHITSLLLRTKPLNAT